MPNRHLERSGCRRREADLLTDALGVAKVINAGGVEVGAIAVAVTTVVEGGAGQPGCGPGWVWHLELARLPEADAVGLKRGAWERKRNCDNRFVASNVEGREREESGVCLVCETLDV